MDKDEQIILERDYWEEKATELAELVGDYFDIEVGEHSNLNCPVTIAIEWIEHEIRERSNMQTTFDKIKLMVARSIVSNYTNKSKPSIQEMLEFKDAVHFLDKNESK